MCKPSQNWDGKTCHTPYGAKFHLPGPRTYARIGDFFKQKCQGYMGYVFTANSHLAKQIGLRPKRKIPFYNTTLDCRLLEYELYAGTRKQKYAEQEEG